MKLVTLPSTFGKFDLGQVAAEVATGANTYYGTLAQINQAKYGSKLLKAQAQAKVAEAKAYGQGAASTAAAGLPSPTLLLVGGIGLAALLILRR